MEDEGITYPRKATMEFLNFGLASFVPIHGLPKQIGLIIYILVVIFNVQLQMEYITMKKTRVISTYKRNQGF
jgi:hypothetical protein